MLKKAKEEIDNVIVLDEKDRDAEFLGKDDPDVDLDDEDFSEDFDFDDTD
jgi:hypothetical protein